MPKSSSIDKREHELYASTTKKDRHTRVYSLHCIARKLSLLYLSLVYYKDSQIRKSGEEVVFPLLK